MSIYIFKCNSPRNKSIKLCTYYRVACDIFHVAQGQIWSIDNIFGMMYNILYDVWYISHGSRSNLIYPQDFFFVWCTISRMTCDVFCVTQGQIWSILEVVVMTYNISYDMFFPQEKYNRASIVLASLLRKRFPSMTKIRATLLV